MWRFILNKIMQMWEDFCDILIEEGRLVTALWTSSV